MNAQSFSNKTVVIAGAGAHAGLCLEIARRFGEAGAFVVIAGEDSSAGLKTQNALHTAGVQSVYEDLKSHDPASCRELIDRVAQQHGRIYTWVNIPVDFATAPAETVSNALWDVGMAALSGAFYCAQAAGRHMLTQPGGGVIINVSSVAGMAHEKGNVASGVVHAGIIALTEALGVEWAGSGVRVVGVAVAPSPAQTDKGLAQFNRRAPMKRPAGQYEVAEAVFYLASNEASYITAETLRVDGGWVAYQLF